VVLADWKCRETLLQAPNLVIKSDDGSSLCWGFIGMSLTGIHHNLAPLTVGSQPLMALWSTSIARYVLPGSPWFFIPSHHVESLCQSGRTRRQRINGNQKTHRKKGLAKTLVAKLFRERIPDFGSDGWASADLHADNHASRALCASLGGRQYWRSSWCVRLTFLLLNISGRLYGLRSVCFFCMHGFEYLFSRLISCVCFCVIAYVKAEADSLRLIGCCLI
jgi:hypothetical protein